MKLYRTTDHIDDEMNVLISTEINTFANIFKDKLSEEVKRAKQETEIAKWEKAGHSFFEEFTAKSRIALVNYIDETLTNVNDRKQRSFNIPIFIDDIQYMCSNAIYMMKMAMEAFVSELNQKPIYQFDGQILLKLKGQNFDNILQRDVRDVLYSMESYKDMRTLEYFRTEINTRLTTDMHNLYDGVAARIKNVEENGVRADKAFVEKFPPQIGGNVVA